MDPGGESIFPPYENITHAVPRRIKIEIAADCFRSENGNTSRMGQHGNWEDVGGIIGGCGKVKTDGK